VTCDIVSFVKSRDNAIEAWEMEGYTPLDELEKEYGLTQEYLFKSIGVYTSLLWFIMLKIMHFQEVK